MNCRSTQAVVCCLAVLHAVACSSDDGNEKAAAGSAADTRGASGMNATSAPSSGSNTATSTAMVPVPTETTVTMPPEAGMVFSASSVDYDQYGYEQKEYFFEGGVANYKVSGGAATDGKWQLEQSSRAAFKSRVLVRLPKDPSKFNGTIVVEWLNVSGGVDADPGFMYNLDFLTREGYGWVGVSAQSVGIQGGGFSLGALAGAGGPMIKPLKDFSPERYGTLSHPGDSYSYDIFTRAAEIIREPKGVDILGGLEAEYLIAYGESQSAGRMVSYINGAHPIAKVYDAFFVHSRGSAGAGFEDSGFGLPGLGGGAAELIRDDLEEPVLQFQTETDVTGALGFLAARQPDTAKIATWEVAGTAHADKYLVDFNKNNPQGLVDCPNANDGPQFRVIRAALSALNDWMRDGKAPPKGAPLETDANGVSLRDEHGNALGGIRSPDVDVPIATLSGDSDDTSALFCFIFGTTTPFTPEKLMQLYPTHEDYVAKVKASAEATQGAGFVLAPEAMGFITEAQNAKVPN